MKALLATAAVSVLLLAACGTAGGTGATTVNVKNSGTMVHEVVVLKTDVPADKIAPDADEPGKMSEDGSQGESGDLDPTQAKTFTVDLEPGNYVLICNQPAHYLLGMHIAFVVK